MEDKHAENKLNPKKIEESITIIGKSGFQNSFLTSSRSLLITGLNVWDRSESSMGNSDIFPLASNWHHLTANLRSQPRELETLREDGRD